MSTVWPALRRNLLAADDQLDVAVEYLHDGVEGRRVLGQGLALVEGEHGDRAAVLLDQRAADHAAVLVGHELSQLDRLAGGNPVCSGTCLRLIFASSFRFANGQDYGAHHEHQHQDGPGGEDQIRNDAHLGQGADDFARGDLGAARVPHAVA